MYPIVSYLRAATLASLLLRASLQSPAAPALSIAQLPDGRVRLSWPAAETGYSLEQSDRIGPDALWSPAPASATTEPGLRTVTVQAGAQARFYRLRGAAAPPPTFVSETSPAPGASGVAVTRETILRFSAPLARETVLTGTALHATFAGRTLLARTELSADRRTATLFYLENLPAAARIRVTLDGSLLKDDSGRLVDADADGQPGGAGFLEFDTTGVIGLPGTAVVGRVFAAERNADGSNKPLVNVTVTVDGAEETLRATTDATGAFVLSPAPAGRFFVHVDGRTAQGSQWPGGTYYPFVGKAWEAVAGRTNNAAGGTGEIYLPLIQAEALRPLNPVAETRVTFADSVLAATPALAGVELRVPPNALFNDNGTRGGKVGMAPVPPDRLPEPLPPGLNFPIVITIQTDGGSNFDQPVPVTFPNLADPVTGTKLGPGERTVLWSFNHDTGHWEPQGTMTISADGRFAVSDPGVGIRQPGWHGNAPGSPGGGPAPGPPCTTGCDDDGDGDGDEGDEDAEDRCRKEKLAAMFSTQDCAVGIGSMFLPSLKDPLAGCAFGIGYGAHALVRDSLISPEDTDLNAVNFVTGSTIGCSEAIFKGAPFVGPASKAAGVFHGCILGALPNVCGAFDCLSPGSDALCAGDYADDISSFFDRKLGDFLRPGEGWLGWLDGVTGRHAPGQQLPGVTQELLDQFRANPFMAQALFSEAHRRFFASIFGSDLWVGPDPGDDTTTSTLLSAALDAIWTDGPGGPTITPEERTAVFSLPRPPQIQDSDLQALLNRLARIADKSITPEELRSEPMLVAAARVAQMTAVYTALGWDHWLDGWREGLVQLTRQFQVLCRPVTPPGAIVGGSGGGGGGGGSGGGGGGSASAGAGGNAQAPRPLSYLLWNLDTGFQLRGKIQTGASIENLILSPDSFYGLFYLDELSGTIGIAYFRSAQSGTATQLPCAVWLDGGVSLPDADGDQLSDLAEQVAGTDPGQADSDGDGVMDGAEVRSLENPRDQDPPATGVIGAVDTPGSAVAVETRGEHAFVADGLAGLAVVQLNGPQNPLLVAQIPTTGPAVDVAVDGDLAALALGTHGLALFDIRQPASPLLRAQLDLGGIVETVAVQLPWILAGADGDLVLLRNSDGAVVSRLDGLGREVDDIQIQGDSVYVLTEDELVTLRLENGLLFVVHILPIAGTAAPLESGRKLLVAGERAYVGYFQGFSILDLANPDLPTVRGVPPVTQAAIHHFVAAGPRLLLPITSFGGTTTLALSAYDVTSPQDTTRFLTSFNTPGEARAAAIHRGLAVVADSSRGVALVNFLSRGPDTLAPTVSLAGRWAAPSPVTEPGRTLRIPVSSDDNTLVREVLLLLDGQVADRDPSFPFAFSLVAPPATAGRTNFILAAVATDLNGNTRTSAPVSVTLVADATPPQIVSFSPTSVANVTREFLTTVAVTFDEPLQAVGDQPLRVFAAGPDALPGTADDVALAGSVRVQDSRTLTWTPATPWTVGRFRAELAAGITDAAGNARSMPLGWSFTVDNTRPQLSAVSPSGRLPTAETLVSNFVATFSRIIPPERAASVAFLLTSIGPDRVWNTVDDGTNTLTRVTPDGSGIRFELATQAALGIGRYRLRAQGPTITARTLEFTLDDPRSFWSRDASSRWDVAGNWTLTPTAGSQVIIDRPDQDITVTNFSQTPLLRSIYSTERFVHAAGDLRVLDEAVFDGLFESIPSQFTDAAFAQGIFRFRAGLDVHSTITGNRRMAIGEATLINEGRARWLTGYIDAGGTDSVFINAPGATFEIGEQAGSWALSPSSAPRLRFVNGGLLHKPAGTNATSFTAISMENEGAIRVEAGALELGAYRGRGTIETRGQGSVTIASGAILVPAARFFGDGTLVLGSSLTSQSDRLGTEVLGAWQVTGQTRVLGAGAQFRSSLDIDSARFFVGGDLTLHSAARIGALHVANATGRGVTLNAPLTVSEFDAERGDISGSGSIAVGRSWVWRGATLGAGGDLVMEGTDWLAQSGQLGNRVLRLASSAGVVVSNAAFGSVRPLHDNITGGIRNEGLLVKQGSGDLSIAVPLTNIGTVRVEGGILEIRRGTSGTLRLQGLLEQAADGELWLLDGGLRYHSSSLVAWPRGTLGGSGTVSFLNTGFPSRLDFGGRLRPGHPTGTLTITNLTVNLLAGASKIYTVTAAGTGKIAGAITLGGLLRLEFAPDFNPPVGTRWTLVEGGSRNFANVEVTGLPPDKRIEIETNGSMLSAVVAAR